MSTASRDERATPALAALVGDLDAEAADLDGLVASLPATDWRRPTPAPGWSIAYQIAHLSWTDNQAALAITDPDTFAQCAAAAANGSDIVEAGAAAGARLQSWALLKRWRSSRIRLTELLGAAPPGSRIPWYGPPMSVRSMATARIMETWAHGQDIADAVGVRRQTTDRLRHIAHLGVRARDYAYQINGQEAPSTEICVELNSPDGATMWTWGPSGATDRVSGPALDFCLLVTRRRHRADLTIVAEGRNADAWLDIAQAFAGPPGAGRRPGEFA